MKELIEELEVDALLLLSRQNKYYCASLYSGSGYVLVTKDKIVVMVDGRYYQQMKEANKHNEVVLLDANHSLPFYLQKWKKENNIKKIVFEKSTISYSEYEMLMSIQDITWVAADVDKIRQIKTKDEIATIQKAGDIASQAYQHILQFIKVGMSEKEVENELLYQMRKLGADKESFDTVIVSGERGALPHGKASDKIIEATDFVTIDFGARYKEYCSDITRTFAMTNNYNQELKRIYDIVLTAQQKAINAIQPGMKCSQIDKVARDYIEKNGYGSYFTHNLGHSIGIDCHENPRLSPQDDTVLQVGMIVTVEPGVYVEGLGGVRIEDDVLVSKNGAVVLTSAPKEFHVIGDDENGS
ncbi:M24 family metallopeptidase [Breznakia pachnodae]|uniref:Xaa-Pro aminopeptidase/Xaa-Pro dipeptidase n=1 Tax=Breznakia pachnodae TaxID=265178 RepID=A0ABU0E1X8_9FIRM|nr:M24 family metallopeptidase [Breznakia pachnodae]MDQ0360886.1 Xaa-Pro aminopeptidase/Xaa-Pro dipeptidase [Breznakia pachnodae]